MIPLDLGFASCTINEISKCASVFGPAPLYLLTMVFASGGSIPAFILLVKKRVERKVSKK